MLNILKFSTDVKYVKYINQYILIDSAVPYCIQLKQMFDIHLKVSFSYTFQSYILTICILVGKKISVNGFMTQSDICIMKRQYSANDWVL